MANLPIYDPAGTVRSRPQGAVQVDADMFGGAQGRALAGVGQQVQGLAANMYRIEEEERKKQEASNVTDASTRASTAWREAAYGEGGIYEQKGANAVGSTDRAKAAAEKIRGEIEGSLSTPEEKEAFSKVWNNYTDANLNGVAKYEFDQRAATRTTAKASALQNATDDVIANYDKPDVLKTNFDLARGIIRSNADGLPPEALTALERSTVSNMHVSVIQRLAADSPGKALDYYNSHKGEVNGVDHAKAETMIKTIGRIRDAKAFTDEAVNAGPANDIVQAVMGTESSGDPTALSHAGAAGLMQLMPNTAREVAVGLGVTHVAQMTDEQLQAYWATEEGQRVNVRLGRNYLGQMMKRFSTDGNADVEAALVAYNAGPANAEKWLNAGRNYDVLPKKGETLPYVQKVMTAWRGTDFSQAGTSADIQRSLNGSAKAYFNGDAKGFLKTRLQAQHGAEAVDGLSTDMSDRLAAMMSAAPGFVKDGLDILSGYRSPEKQASIISKNAGSYGLDRAAWDADVSSMGPEAAGAKWAGKFKASGMSEWYGKPGGSRHQHGDATDLGWNGGKFSSAPKEVRDWVKANAANYGLNFPMDYEPWHIETAEARKGNAAAIQRNANFDEAAGIPPSGDGRDAGFIEVAQGPGNAASIYMNATAPFSVPTAGGSLEAALSSARERFADDPDMLAEVERQITNTKKESDAATKEQVEGIKRGLLQGLLVNGQSPRDAEPSKLAAIGAEGVKQLFSLEDDMKQGGARITDDATYIELVNMTPEQLKNADIMTYAPNLSRPDLQKFANMQAEYRRGNSAALRSATQTRQQIVSNAAAMTGLDAKGAENAMKLSALNRQVDLEIAAYVERKGEQPDGIEIQKIVDGLIMRGKKTGGVFGIGSSGTTKRIFELAPEEVNNFYAASGIDDIPQEARPKVSAVFKTVYQMTENPDETTAVNMFNDMVRVERGGSPMPPSALATQFRQAFTRKANSVATDEDLMKMYRMAILEANNLNGK